MNDNLKLGVFVDAENVKCNGGYQLRYDVLRRFAARNGGTLLRLNTYLAFDQERAREDTEYAKRSYVYQQTVRDFGWKVIIKNVRRYTDEEGNVTSKANADLDMAVDALLQSEYLDRVVFATGDGDFVKVVVILVARAIREQDLLAVVMDLRVADVAFGVLENGPNLFPFHVIDAQLSAGVHGKRGSTLVRGIVRDAGVPMAVDAGLAHGKQDFVGHAGVERDVHLFAGVVQMIGLECALRLAIFLAPNVQCEFHYL